MAKPRRRYSEAFKQQAVEFYLSVAEFKSIKDVAEELGVHKNSLGRWIAAATSMTSAKGISEPERAELLRLRKENRVLKEELEISKKAAAFFAREPRR